MKIETLAETIRRERAFLVACDGEQADRVQASLDMHIKMLEAEGGRW